MNRTKNIDKDPLLSLMEEEDINSDDEIIKESDDENVKEDTSAKHADGVDNEEEDSESLKNLNKSKPAEAKEPAEGSEHVDPMDSITTAALPEGTFKADIDALVESEATLSDGFKSKAQTIFESALKQKIKESNAALVEQYNTMLAEARASIEEELSTKIDNYLSYVVEEWMNQNKLAIDNGLRTEIAESFMNSLHGLFTDHYVEIPEAKINLVDELAEKIETLEASLNESLEKSVSLTKQIADLRKGDIIAEAVKDLTESQAEKLKALAEDLEFDIESFESKVSVLKETYFNTEKGKTVLTEDLNDMNNGTIEETEISPKMAVYLKALKKTNQ